MEKKGRGREERDERDWGLIYLVYLVGFIDLVALLVGGGSTTLAVRSRPYVNGKVVSGIDQGDM